MDLFLVKKTDIPLCLHFYILILMTVKGETFIHRAIANFYYVGFFFEN